MPQQRIPDYWRRRVLSHLASTGRTSDRKICQRLENEATELKEHSDSLMRALADRVPSERTIGRIRQHEWNRLLDAEQAQYREFYWPESMEAGDLPWEASAAALELLGAMAMNQPFRRPSLRAIKWFWRICQASPEAPLDVRMELALGLMATEVKTEPDKVRGIEWFVVHGAWRNGEAWDQYNRATTRDMDPQSA